MFIALTGGIGCGKSLVLAEFAGLGFRTGDADRICHEYYQTGAGRKALAERWGEKIWREDGSLDRAALGDAVFRDPVELAWLENLIRPWLREKLEALRKEAAGKAVIVEVPLLFEKEMACDFDAVIAVWSDFAARRRRLAARGWDHGECSRRERLQWPPERKLAAADYGIVNQGSLPLLRAQCQVLAEKLRRRFRDSV